MLKATSKKNEYIAKLGFVAKLWLAADKLRNDMDATEYKHVVPGLIFFSHAFEDQSSPTLLIRRKFD